MFVYKFFHEVRGQPASYFNKAIMLWLEGVVFQHNQWHGLLLTTALVRLRQGLEEGHLFPHMHLLFSHPFFPPLSYSAIDRLKCMVSSLSHFSHAVGLKDKDGLCSEGLIDQNNCASICLLKAEQTTESQGLYFHQLSQPLMLLT